MKILVINADLIYRVLLLVPANDCDTSSTKNRGIRNPHEDATLYFRASALPKKPTPNLFLASQCGNASHAGQTTLSKILGILW